LPKGTWYDYETKESLAGNRTINYDAPLETLPVFIKEGAIIPTKQLGQYTTEKGVDTITLEVFPLQREESATSILYMDDGETKDSPFVLFKFDMKKSGSNLSIEITKTGSFDGIKSFNVKVYSKPPSKVNIDNKVSAFRYEDGVVSFPMKEDVNLLELIY
jgi:alpha-glucosidase